MTIEIICFILNTVILQTIPSYPMYAKARDYIDHMFNNRKCQLSFSYMLIITAYKNIYYSNICTYTNCTQTTLLIIDKQQIHEQSLQFLVSPKMMEENLGTTNELSKIHEDIYDSLSLYLYRLKVILGGPSRRSQTPKYCTDCKVGNNLERC